MKFEKLVSLWSSPAYQYFLLSLKSLKYELLVYFSCFFSGNEVD